MTEMEQISPTNILIFQTIDFVLLLIHLFQGISINWVDVQNCGSMISML